MKVTYLNHSGFMVEQDSYLLLFDYYTGNLDQLDGNKQIYVFASHKHPDHFNYETLKLYDKYPRVHYFLSDDIRLSDAFFLAKGIDSKVKNAVHFLKKNQTYEFSTTTNEEIQSNQMDEILKIETLRSTDIGVAFIVTLNQISIYHGGDLNWWHWSGEKDSFNKMMKVKYQYEIDKLKGRHFQLSFVPMDPRQEENYGLGMDYFIANTTSDHIFPMHMWDQYQWIDTYLASQNESDDSVVIQNRKNIRKITKKEQIFEF